MRVAHIITRMIIGGAQENTLFSCQDLVREHGDTVMLISGPSRGPEGALLGESITDEIQLQIIPSLCRAIDPWRDWRSYGAIKQQLRSFQPDVVHTHSAKAGMLGRLAAWSLRVPAIVHTVHGAPFHRYQPALARSFFRRCEKFAASRCHKLISVADAMTDQLVGARVAPADKFCTILSGMDVDRFARAGELREQARRQLGYEPGDVVIGKIARLFHLKGHEELVRAATRVVQQQPRARFLLVGDGILRAALEQQIRQADLQEYFTFTGLVPPTEIPSLIGAMDMLVHTSLREGLARALPQALIAGKPVVSYDVDGAREVVIPDQTGFLVPPQDIDALADALGTLSTDLSLREKLGGEGQRRFTEPFRHQSMTRQIREVYSQLLRQRHGPGRDDNQGLLWDSHFV